MHIRAFILSALEELHGEAMKTGCNNGCVHRKEIKLPDMREIYDFRCDKLGGYIKFGNVKKSCRMFRGHYVERPLLITDFLSEYN